MWNMTDSIQMFCGNSGCPYGEFAPAKVPVYGEFNVGFSLTFANLLLPTLPEGHGVIICNTGVGGTGFISGQWTIPSGPLVKATVTALQSLVSSIPTKLGGTFGSLDAMLWHQGEDDAGDNGMHYHATYCTYLMADQGALIDFMRANLPGASASTPFVNGGLLPYWVDEINGVANSSVMTAIYAVNTSRVCTGTADSRIFPDFLPGNVPDGDPYQRSGVSNAVIHFNATQAVLMGYQYWEAFHRALNATNLVPSIQTKECDTALPPSVPKCGAPPAYSMKNQMKIH
eukprot:Phypoly_transcript_13951.p1 GENE.Phypoly_transcript_13951~~Phypoly_transcript_13951.p1  ORF type:complete len:286 (+),score=40.86 Phypoly_transcript_13951:101-958(+)